MVQSSDASSMSAGVEPGRKLILDLNLRDTFVGIKHELVQIVREGGWVIVNIRRGGHLRRHLLRASTHAIIRLIWSAVLDYAGQYIRANAVLRGKIESR